jgi:hypothetical protein
MEELKIGNTINFEGQNYVILFFHKGAGGSEETARLIDENGHKRDVLKRVLIASLLEKSTEATKKLNNTISDSKIIVDDTVEKIKELNQEVKQSRKYNKKEK